MLISLAGAAGAAAAAAALAGLSQRAVAVAPGCRCPHPARSPRRAPLPSRPPRPRQHAPAGAGRGSGRSGPGGGGGEEGVRLGERGGGLRRLRAGRDPRRAPTSSRTAPKDIIPNVVFPSGEADPAPGGLVTLSRPPFGQVLPPQSQSIMGSRDTWRGRLHLSFGTWETGTS